jgi:hydroxypyruvate isomerase
MNAKLSRRTALRNLIGSTAVLSSGLLPQNILAQQPSSSTTSASASAPTPILKGRIRQSASRWCYGKIPFDDLCRAGKEMGLQALDLLNPPEFETVRKHGLSCSMVSNPTINGLGGIGKAWNRVEHHDKLVQAYEERLKVVADAGFERLICFSGNREGLDDAKGIENCAIGLKRILPLAEKLNVTLCMELLNSKRNHTDYQCDHTAWGVALAKRIGSERFKLLYDIFHMQIMEGDVCDTIKENHAYFDHYHTGGVPGRGEIDDSQELNFRRILQTIADTGYKGFVAHEFTPKRPDALGSLRQAIQICDV